MVHLGEDLHEGSSSGGEMGLLTTGAVFQGRETSTLNLSCVWCLGTSPATVGALMSMAGLQHGYTLSPSLGQQCLLLPAPKPTLGWPCILCAGFVAQQDSAFLSLTKGYLCLQTASLENTQGKKTHTLTCTFLPCIQPWSTQLLGFSGNREALENQQASLHTR